MRGESGEKTLNRLFRNEAIDRTHLAPSSTRLREHALMRGKFLGF